MRRLSLEDGDVAVGKRTAAASNGWIAFEDEADDAAVRTKMGTQGLPDPLVRAHIQLGGPIVLVWDNLVGNRCASSSPPRRLAHRLPASQLRT
jgi:hypothetical protein